MDQDDAYQIPANAYAVYVGNTGDFRAFWTGSNTGSNGKYVCDTDDPAFESLGHLKENSCSILGVDPANLPPYTHPSPKDGWDWTKICGGNPRDRPNDTGFWSYPNPAGIALANNGYNVTAPGNATPSLASRVNNQPTLSGVAPTPEGQQLTDALNAEVAFNATVVAYDTCRQTYLFHPQCMDNW